MRLSILKLGLADWILRPEADAIEIDLNELTEQQLEV